LALPLDSFMTCPVRKLAAGVDERWDRKAIILPGVSCAGTLVLEEQPTRGPCFRRIEG
jgi:hypothetical protein